MLKSHSFPDKGFFSGLAGKSLVVTLWVTRPWLGNYVTERCRQKASPLLCGNVNVGVRLSTRPCCTVLKFYRSDKKKRFCLIL